MEFLYDVLFFYSKNRWKYNHFYWLLADENGFNN